MSHPRHAPPCPACGGQLRDQPAQNATSRFYFTEPDAGPVFICSRCGEAEAFGGRFWDSRDTYPGAAILLQAPWRAAWAVQA